MPTAKAEKQAEAQAEARRARRARRRDRSRDEILAAARTVLLRGGVAAMTLDAVAREAGISKTGIYYYFASKDALVFELVFGVLEQHAHGVQAAIDAAPDGGAALTALIRETVTGFAPRMDDFRLAFLFGQVGASDVQMSPEQFARLRPINDMVFGSAAAALADGKGRKQKGAVEPRLLAFLAYLAALGLLTMKGVVEAQGDPLLYSDEQLVDGLARIFRAAAG